MKMAKRILVPVCLSAALLVSPAWAAAQSKAQPSVRSGKQPAKPSARRNPSRTPAPGKKPRRTASRKRAPQRAPVARGQLRPTRQRYAEIQAALAKAGYFQGPTSGDWGTSSENALASFQKGHGLEPTGKIDALTLIKLDLGPNYGAQNEARNLGASPPP